MSEGNGEPLGKAAGVPPLPLGVGVGDPLGVGVGDPLGVGVGDPLPVLLPVLPMVAEDMGEGEKLGVALCVAVGLCVGVALAEAVAEALRGALTVGATEAVVDACVVPLTEAELLPSAAAGETVAPALPGAAAEALRKADAQLLLLPCAEAPAEAVVETVEDMDAEQGVVGVGMAQAVGRVEGAGTLVAEAQPMLMLLLAVGEERASGEAVGCCGEPVVELVEDVETEGGAVGVPKPVAVLSTEAVGGAAEGVVVAATCVLLAQTEVAGEFVAVAKPVPLGGRLGAGEGVFSPGEGVGCREGTEVAEGKPLALTVPVIGMHAV